MMQGMVDVWAGSSHDDRSPVPHERDVLSASAAVASSGMHPQPMRSRQQLLGPWEVLGGACTVSFYD